MLAVLVDRRDLIGYGPCDCQSEEQHVPKLRIISFETRQVAICRTYNTCSSSCTLPLGRGNLRAEIHEPLGFLGT